MLHLAIGFTLFFSFLSAITVSLVFHSEYKKNYGRIAVYSHIIFSSFFAVLSVLVHFLFLADKIEIIFLLI